MGKKAGIVNGHWMQHVNTTPAQDWLNMEDKPVITLTNVMQLTEHTPDLTSL